MYCRPLAVSVAVTETPGNTLLDWSVTTPVRVAVLVCARAAAVNDNRIESATNTHRTVTAFSLVSRMNGDQADG